VTGLLSVDEEHRLEVGGGEQVVHYTVFMRCWSPDELRERLARAGFEDVRIEGSPGPPRS
jgi:hypothetical protein